MESPDIVGLLDNLSREQRLALDTESDAYHRYFEKVCLIQVSTARHDFFFDPLAHGMPDAVRGLLETSTRTVVLHGGDYDVRSLKHSFALTLGKVFDTAIAAQILGRKEVGLKALLEQELEVVIDKGEQRSDWGKRPLSDAQLRYARRDTMHLLPLAASLEAKLEDMGRLSWHEEECRLLIEREPQERVFDPEGWRKLKGAKDLGARGRKALAALFVWRDQAARAADRPPFRILRSDVIVRLSALVEEQGRSVLRRLPRLKLLPPHTDRDGICRAIERGLEGPDPGATRPTEQNGRPRPPGDPQAKKRLERLRAGRREWSKNMGLDPGFLVSAHVLERIAREPPRDLSQLRNIAGMTDWRVEAVGPRILDALGRA